MATLTVDTNDSVNVLKACRNMLNELIGELPVTTDSDQDESNARLPVSNESDVSQPGHEVDHNNVPYNSEICSSAKEPFYNNGGREGQWKKRRGVSEDEYDKWYKEELAKLSVTTLEPVDEPVNTADAFSAQTQEPRPDPEPTTCGEFMGWVAARQAAGDITQDDIGNAYIKADLTVASLFPPHSEEEVAANIKKLYDIMVTQ